MLLFFLFIPNKEVCSSYLKCSFLNNDWNYKIKFEIERKPFDDIIWINYYYKIGLFNFISLFFIYDYFFY